MLDFNYYVRTDVRFGKGQIKSLKELVAKYNRQALGQLGEIKELENPNVLLVYGGGSIKKNGIYNDAMEALQGCKVCELNGIEPNPKIEKIREGAKLCKENDIDIVVAIGGGSVIDSSKVVAAGAYYDGDPWDMVLDSNKIGKVLPVIAILTIAATGSECNKNAVVSNMETNEKLGTSSKEFIPRAAICDPTYLFSLPAIQTAAGTADIMSHTFEQYFRRDTGAYLTQSFCESILKTCIKYCPVALQEPDNYEARANLMWASTTALNSLMSCGTGGAWTCHPIEHELSAYYDITHGVGLAIVTPRWMRYILNKDTVLKFAQYGHNVWNIRGELDSIDGLSKGELSIIANEAIDRTEMFFKACGIPMTLTEIGIDDSKIDLMAEDTIKYNDLSNAFVPLTKEDISKILRMCL